MNRSTFVCVVLALASTLLMPAAQAAGRGLSRDLEFNLDALQKHRLLSPEKVRAIRNAYRDGSYRPDVTLPENWIGDNYWVDTGGGIHRRINGPNGKYHASRDRVPLVVDVIPTEFGTFLVRDSCRNLMVGPYEQPTPPAPPKPQPQPIPQPAPPPVPGNLSQYQMQESTATATAKAQAKASARINQTIIINSPGVPEQAYPGYGYDQLRPGEERDYGSNAPAYFPYGSSGNSFDRGQAHRPRDRDRVPPEQAVPRTKPPFREIRRPRQGVPGGY